MTTLLVATRNAHKSAEIRAILGDGFRVLCLKDFPAAPTAVEDADTFAGNAAKKATMLADWLRATAPAGVSGEKCFVLADDSGLEVDALNGAPGVHSARFAALESGAPSNSSDAANNAKLLRLLKDIPAEKRTARFRCVLSLAEINPPSAIRSFSRARARAALNSRPAAAAALATTRCSCPMASRNRSLSWAKT